MLAKLIENRKEISETQAAKASHVLFLLPAGKDLPVGVPGTEALRQAMARRGHKPNELAKTPQAVEQPGGSLTAWAMVDLAKSVFERHAHLRKALGLLLSERPATVTIVLHGEEGFRAQVAEEAAYVALINTAELPSRKSEKKKPSVKRISIHGWESADGMARARAQAEGNTLARSLTWLPPNELTPGQYRQNVRELAKANGWRHRELDLKKLRKMGAGAFVAVAQGSEPEDAAIVHLTYQGRATREGRKVALVGKGICFDTGGHNLKPARYMHGMHEDMNGSAVALGILLAATRLKLPLTIDAWLALAQNHISPKAYKQNEVVTALNGTTIEVVHTDAEGRMVLADTLTLAARQKPDLIVDFATLTGAMHVALGERMSGVFSNRADWLDKALVAGGMSGERVNPFPLEDDYEEALESKIADVKQCTMEGEADHILASRFLRRFVEDRPWIHMDLSASSCKGGLGAAGTDITGFGVGWGLALLLEAR
jgi:leucyl aminopeptidase